jgi:hypothetical protein
MQDGGGGGDYARHEKHYNHDAAYGAGGYARQA